MLDGCLEREIAMTAVDIHVAKEFSKYPSGRTRSDSRYSGEEFRERFLISPLRQGKKVNIFLDGTLGYGSSFLDEAFGGLIRKDMFAVGALESQLHLITKYSDLDWEIWSYIRGS